MGAFKELRLLLWKNLLTQLRSPWFTIFEIALPLLLIGLPLGLMIRYRHDFEGTVSERNFARWPVTGSANDLVVPVGGDFEYAILPFMSFIDNTGDSCNFLEVTRLNSGYGNYRVNVEIAYAPNVSHVREIMEQHMQQRFTSIVNVSVYSFAQGSLDVRTKLTGFASESELTSYMVDSFKVECNNPLWGGIVFEDDFVKNPQSSSIRYKIRLPNTKRRYSDDGMFGKTFGSWDTKTLFKPQVFIGIDLNRADDGGAPGYWREGFLSLQKGVDDSIGDYLTKTSPNPLHPDMLLVLERFPLPPYKLQIIEIGALFLPVIVVFSFLTSVIYIVGKIVAEKENQLKEYMKVMGLSPWIHWVAHFISNYIKLVITVIALTVLLSVIMPKSDATVIFVFFMLYAFNVVYFAFAVSTFLQSGTLATLIAVVSWLFLWFWMIFVDTFNLIEPYSFGLQMANCLNPNVGMNFAFTLMSKLEVEGGGLTWSNAFKVLSADYPVTLGHLFLMQIVDAVILILVTWYVEAINPGGEGVPQKPWFFVLPSYWLPARATRLVEIPSRSENQTAKVEHEGSDLHVMINIVDLCKNYGTSVFKKIFDCKFDKTGEKKAVDHLNIDVYKGQITALLGHNGAGKSTTFSMLTGVIPPTSGTAYINGYDIRTSLPKIRKSLGLCPQYNILFNLLTVKEHLEFFCKLKGCDYVEQDAMDLLVRLKLDEKKGARAATLSGGQKRKLSLAIALIGGSEVVMLDEPTSGMDPGARHDTWALLQEEKTNRSILLSTHFMEEADVLGDRIAILANGKLQCCGSAMFLKSEYGAGYHVTVVYSSEARLQQQDTLAILQRFSPNAELNTSVGSEASFLLPAEDRPIFPEVFRTLETLQKQLGIDSFGVSVTTMEEVFLKVNKIADERAAEEEGVPLHVNELNFDNLKVKRRLTGTQLYLQHAATMFRKRFIYFYRRWTQFIPQLLLPIILLILLVWAATGSPSAEAQPPLPITITTYDRAHIYYHYDKDYPHLKEDLGKVCALQAPNDNVDLETYTYLTDTVATENKKQGTMSFGMHNPLAVMQGIDTYITQRPTLTTNVYFNNYGQHSPPLAVNIGDMLILKKRLGRDVNIQVVNHPLPPASADTQKSEKIKRKTNPTQQYAIIVAMALVVSGYSSFLIREQKKKSKHMQMLTGLKVWMYWLTTFIWDFFTFLLPMFCFIVVYAAFRVENYTHNGDAVGTLILVMLLFAWGAIPLVYAFSFAFKSPSKGYMVILIYNIVSGIIGSIAVPVVQMVKGKATARNWEIFFALFFPSYNLGTSFGKIYENEGGRLTCAQLDCSNPIVHKFAGQCCDPNAKNSLFIPSVLGSFDDKGILLEVVFLLVQGFLFWILVMLIENRLLSWIRWPNCCRSAKVSPAMMENGTEKQLEDSDVLRVKEEVERINSASEHKVLAKNLKKNYGSFSAVKGVSFRVSQENCFGLLGVNGAGKTSTFQMLTGENTISEGEALINNYSVRSEWHQARTHIGYCPQYDAVMKEMSGEETLYMFARLRGVPKEDIPPMVETVIEAIGIGIYAKRQIKTYSGGNKRRLSLGIALVGMPEIFLLDEPTTGVDPRARRIIWNILSKARSEGTAIVLTSHSMEECEALCTSLAIMVSGQFRCYGSVQHLKNRYGSGYTLLVRLTDTKHSGEVKEAFMREFPGSILKEDHLLQLHFQLKRSAETSWSSLFAKMEEISKHLSIADYSLSQITLEQVFLEFSKEVL